MIAYYPAQDYGFSPDGHPVLLDHFPLSDPNAVVSAFGVEEVINFHIWAMERQLRLCEESSDKLGRPVTDAIFVFNMNGLQCTPALTLTSSSFHSYNLLPSLGISRSTSLSFSLSLIPLSLSLFESGKHMGSSALSLIKPTFQIDADYYPETVAAVFVINAPRVFSILYRLASPFVDPKTLQKVKIFGSEWLPEVLKSSPGAAADNFPVSWGGSAHDPWIRLGGSSIGGASGQDSVTTTLSVAAGDCAIVPVEVEKDKSSLLWEFTLPAYDIEFSIELVGKKENEVIEKPSRLSSDPDPCQGMREGLQKGTYNLIFSNKYSWATSKTVNLTYSVTYPLSKSQKKKKGKK
jgi:hypothetical protein